MLSLAMSKLARLNSGTAQLSEIMDAEKQVREWRDKCETNAEVSERGPLASANTKGETRDSLH